MELRQHREIYGFSLHADRAIVRALTDLNAIRTLVRRCHRRKHEGGSIGSWNRITVEQPMVGQCSAPRGTYQKPDGGSDMRCLRHRCGHDLRGLQDRQGGRAR